MRKFSSSRPPLQYSSLDMLKTIQLGFGLVQDDVAMLLGVTRATLTMDGQPTSINGIGTRSLPPDASKRLLALHQAVPMPFGPASGVPEPAPAHTLPDTARQDLDIRLRSIQLKQYRLEKQLARAQLRVSQAHRRLHALPALRAAFPDQQDEAEWVHFEQQAHQWLRTDGYLPQLLELKLRVLAFEAAELRQLLG